MWFVWSLKSFQINEYLLYVLVIYNYYLICFCTHINIFFINPVRFTDSSCNINDHIFVLIVKIQFFTYIL